MHRAVGGITENDITLAATTNATIIGFNVRPDRKAREAADAEDVEIRTYEIIYKLLEDIEQAMVGMLAPEYEEVVTGDAEVREIFRVPRIGAIAGCYVQNGTITRGSKVRFLRDGTIIWKGDDHVAAALQGGRPRGPRGLRVRHRPVRLPGPQAGRRHRDLRRARDRAYLTEAQPDHRSTWPLAGRRPSSSRSSGGHRYPRSARVGETLREIIADELVRIDDERLELVTVTAIEVDDELNRADRVLRLARRARTATARSSTPSASTACGCRSSIARQIRAKKTPILDLPARRRDPLGGAHRRTSCAQDRETARRAEHRT